MIWPHLQIKMHPTTISIANGYGKLRPRAYVYIQLSQVVQHVKMPLES